MTARESHAALRPARPEEAAALSALCLRSKAVWGYDAAFLQACRGELTLSAPEITAGGVLVAERDGRAAGVARLGVAPGGEAEILLLFVEPARLGHGIGRRLFAALERMAKDAGCSRLVAVADPGAEGFYLRMGMERAGEEASGSIPGRRLPKLEKRL